MLSGSNGWPEITLPECTVEYPRDTKHGDVASNIAMKLAPLIKKSPLAIGKLIIGQINDNPANANRFARIELVAPGFINFYFHPSFYEQKVKEVIKSGNKYAQTTTGKGKKVILEFISANPTGPLHMGNGRGAFLGDALASVLVWTGHEVIREYYFNDRGEQIELLGKSVTLRYLEQQGEKVTYPADCYQGEYIKELAREIGKDIQPNIKELNTVIKDKALEKMITGIKELITRQLQIVFDVWFSEKSLYSSGAVQQVVQFLQKKDLVYEKEGALWMKTKQAGDDKDRVLRKSSGAETYFLSDIAYHWDKLEKRGADFAINIWGADHHGYVDRLRAGVKAIGHENQLQIILIQLVKLVSKGKEIRMSKRSGTFVTLKELIDEVGSDVARFFFLLHDVNTSMEFDLDLAKERSEKNPVFYVQYAHARICSILQQIKEQNYDFSAGEEGEIELREPAELALAREISKLPQLLEDVVESRAVQHLASYSIELARRFHDFYNQHRVIEKEQVNSSRWNLIQATKITLRVTLRLLGVSAPEKM